MQVNDTFREAVDYLIEELRKTQLPQQQWAQLLSEKLDLDCPAESVKSIREQFPEVDSVLKKFDTEPFQKELAAVLEGSDPLLLAAGEGQAMSFQLQLLLSLQKRFSRRKVPRASRVVNAAYRRAILTAPDAPINKQLLEVVENLLSRSR